MKDTRIRWRRYGWGAGILAVGALAGGLIALGVPAAAENAAAPSASSAPSARAQPPADGPAPVRDDEKALSVAEAAKVKAAALAAVPGATIYRTETDGDGAAYEAHLTKADGTKATVKLDKNFTVTSVEDGMGTTKDGHGGPPSR